ncbi:MAG: cysteine synthase family protein [Rikenellaceae bacterium]|jgi:cysteine synthase A|nr:cysteine synthase family protein [Rikenellaceae bacterium]
MNTLNDYKMIERRLDSLVRLIGNTPMVAIRYRLGGREATVYAKCEHYNYTGSIKDRMALHILREAYRSGRLHPGDRIVEVTSGNTGIAITALGRALGHPVSIIMPDWMSRERMDIITGLGGEVIRVSREEGGFTGGLRLADKMAEEDGGIFLPLQFSNGDNVNAHRATTGPEVWRQLADAGLCPDAFVAGVGTGGTVMGVGGYLRDKRPEVMVHPLEPQESPTLSTGYKVGSHRIQGISDDFIPEIVKLNELDEVVQVSDGDAILMAQKLSRTFGMAVGISSGGNLVGAMKLQEKYGHRAVVATVFADCNKKYLSTDLMRPEPERDHHVTPRVELLDFSFAGR